jgi:hypothetical protein
MNAGYLTAYTVMFHNKLLNAVATLQSSSFRPTSYCLLSCTSQVATKWQGIHCIKFAGEQSVLDAV